MPCHGYIYSLFGAVFCGIFTSQLGSLAEPSHPSFSEYDLQPVHWQVDKGWFNDRVIADRARSKKGEGCCPVAIALYAGRYAHVDYRCCTRHLSQLLPLRPKGGMEWGDSNYLKNTSIQIVGDSLAEQHFIALLCFAWATPGYQVDNLQNDKLGGSNSTWGPGASWSAIVNPLGTRIIYVRSNQPTIERYVQYDSASFLIVGGAYWNHGGLANFPNYLCQIERMRLGRPTLVIEALPIHFPGGSYRGDGKYRHAENEINGSVCDLVSNKTEPDINPLLTLITQKYWGDKPLELAELYRERGDAHVGPIPEGVVGPRGRDCKHWCVAPGVLDAAARAILMALHGRAMSKRVNHSESCS